MILEIARSINIADKRVSVSILIQCVRVLNIGRFYFEKIVLDDESLLSLSKDEIHSKSLIGINKEKCRGYLHYDFLFI